MALTIVDFPETVAKAVNIRWRMEHNHGQQLNPFSGTVLPIRGFLERWAFSITFKAMTRVQAQQLQGFFLELEGGLHVFRMRDPSQPSISGSNATNPVVATNAFARDHTVAMSGFSTTTGTLKAGDWIQFPKGQMSKVMADVTGDGATGVDVRIWPHLWQDEAAGGTVIASTGSPAYGYWRLRGLPDWTADVKNLVRPFDSSLEGYQEVLQETVVYP